jgi:hypothetical protein
LRLLLPVARSLMFCIRHPSTKIEEEDDTVVVSNKVGVQLA